MSEGSWVDLVPMYERERLRKRLRSPEAYAESREKVKSPEEIAREMDRSAMLAELRFGLETEPGLKEALKKQIEKYMRERGPEAVLARGDLPPEIRRAIESGNFDVRVDAPSEDEPDQVMIAPTGNVAETVALQKGVGDAYASQFCINL